MGRVPGATRRSLFAQVRFVPRDGKRFAAARAAQHRRNGEQWRAVVTARTHAIVLAPALGQPRVPRRRGTTVQRRGGVPTSSTTLPGTVTNVPGSSRMMFSLANWVTRYHAPRRME